MEAKGQLFKVRELESEIDPKLALETYLTSLKK